MRRREWELGLAVLMAVAACKGTEPPSVPASINLSATDTDLDVGESVQAAVVGRSAGGAQVALPTIHWTTSDSLVARVSTSGAITGEGRGTALISASSGSIQGSLQVKVVDRAHSVAFTSTDMPTVLTGDSVTMRAVVRDSALGPMSPRPLRWVSRVDSLATISSSGVLHGKSKGKVWIVARSGAVRDSQLVVVIPRRGGPNRDVAYRHFPASATSEEVWVWAGPGRFNSERASQRGRPVRAYRWSADGQWLLIAYRPTPLQPAAVELVDPSLGNRLGLILSDPQSIDLAPDNSMLAVSVASGTRHQVALISPDGTGFRTITDGTDSAIWPIWSPDSRQLAFLRASDADQIFGALWVMRADGSAQVRVAARARNVAWSPDAQKIAFDDGDRVWVVARDGSGLTAMSPPSDPGLATENGRPRWSSDGKQLVYTSSGEVRVQYGSATYYVSRGDASVKHADFSPDGQFVLYASASGVIVAPSVGGGLRASYPANNVEPFPLWRP